MKALCLPAILIFFLIFGSIVAYAGDEQAINQALRNQQEVTLQEGVYTLEGPVVINSGNSLIGQPGTILRVSSSSSQWFTPGKGIIYSEGRVDNVRIEGFSIDGNCQNLPRSYANTPGHDKDCEKAIVLKGYSNQFSNNIIISRMKIYDCFSDAIYIGFSTDVHISELEASNCQHSTIYFSEVMDSIIQDCKIWGITSDNVRVENSKRIEVAKNLLYTYMGDHANGAYQGGQNFIQIANQGYSHGYGSPKQDRTSDINAHDNVFSGKNYRTIWINGVEDSANVWIHNNTYVDSPEIETEGFSVEHPPSIEQAEKTFMTIYDFLKQDYSFKYPAVQHDFGATAVVTDDNESSTVRVSGKDLKVVKFEYSGKTARHFIERDIWTGELAHVGNDAYIQGNFQPEDLKITVYGDVGFQKVEKVEVRDVKLASAGINPDFFIFIAILAVLGITTYRNIRRIL